MSELYFQDINAIEGARPVGLFYPLPVGLVDANGAPMVSDIQPANNAYGLITRPVIPLTSFGEMSVAENTPIVQSMATYGITAQMTPFNINGGTSTFGDSMYKVNSGTNTIALGGLLTTRQLTYRPGQGISARFTAVFDTPQDGSDQQVGMITSTDTAAFGYKDEVFGIIYQHGGKVEIQTLTVSGAASGSENATITVDGTEYTVPLTAGTVAHNAYEIAKSLNAQVTTYRFSSNQDEVVARSLFAAAGSTFAFSSGTATGSWAQLVSGALYTDDFIAKASWNICPDFDITPAFGNVFEIKTQFLGFGAIQFFIESRITGHFELVHIIQYANTAIIPSFSNPTFRIGGIAVNRTNTTDLQVMFASVAGFVEGKHTRTESPRAVSSIVASVPISGLTNLLTLRNRLVLDGVRNRVEIFMLRAFAAVDSTKNAIVSMYINAEPATGTDDLTFSYIDQTSSATEIATDKVLMTGGRFVDAFIVSDAGREIDLEQIGILLEEGQSLTFAGNVVSGSSSEMSLTSTFLEDF